MPGPPKFEWPGPTERTIIVGQTGSGKTQFGAFLLSRQDLHARPWLIIDYKREGLFRRLERQRVIRAVIKPGNIPPRRPGLYIMRPDESDDEAVDATLWGVLAKRNIGVYIDEAYMPPAGRGSAIRAILTQGRSLRIPVIALAQRPVDLDRFYFSESQNFGVFFLLDRDDKITVRRFVPIDVNEELPPFYCRWYSTRARHLYCLQPAPNADSIVADFVARAPRQFWLG